MFFALGTLPGLGPEKLGPSDIREVLDSPPDLVGCALAAVSDRAAALGAENLELIAGICQLLADVDRSTQFGIIWQVLKLLSKEGALRAVEGSRMSKTCATVSGERGSTSGSTDMPGV